MAIPAEHRGISGLFVVALAAALTCAASPVHAEELGGEYTVGPQSVKVAIHSWGEDCGPKPKGYSSKGKGSVTVTHKGDHLYFSNGRSTKKCWSANPKLRRLSVTKKGSTWTIVCESPPSDSRYEHGTYVVKATPSSITVKDTSKYNWKLKESVCKATISIKRVFVKKVEEPEPAEEPEEEKDEEQPGPPPKIGTIEKEYPEPPQPARCESPGPPVKTVVLPASVKTTPGRKVCFKAYEVDKNGCRTPVHAEFKLIKEQPDRVGRLEGRCFVPGEIAAESEGTFRIVATHGYDTATAKVVVLSASIEDLIAVNLDPAGAGDTQEPESEPEAPAPREEKVDVPVAGKRKPPVFLLYVLPPAFLLVVMAVIVVVAVRERKKRLGRRIAELEEQRLREQGGEDPAGQAPPTEEGAPARPRRQARMPASSAAPRAQAPPPAEAPAAGMICSVCGRHYPSSSRFCPHDGSMLVAEGQEDEQETESGLICPRCGRGYPPGTRNCGEDGELLVPAPVADAGLDRTGSRPARGQKKICPVCSEVYSDDSTFCGKDGAELVPMN